MSAKQYLGDGVYAAWSGWSVWLTTENGIETTNKIELEPEVLGSFLQYVERLKQRLAVERLARAQVAALDAVDKALEPEKEGRDGG